MDIESVYRHVFIYKFIHIYTVLVYVHMCTMCKCTYELCVYMLKSIYFIRCFEDLDRLVSVKIFKIH